MLRSLGATAALAAAAATASAPRCANAATASTWVVRPEWVKAHENFLASDALQGRGSATRDEAIAAAYVASQFERFGLKTAPGMSGYTQVAQIVRPRLTGTPTLSAADGSALNSLKLFFGAASTKGEYAVLRSADPKQMPASDVVIVTDSHAVMDPMMGAAIDKHVKLLILPASQASEKLYGNLGGKPRLRAFLKGASPAPMPVLATLSASDIDMLAAQSRGAVTLTVPIAEENTETTNAIGYLPGTDPKAGNLLVSAHLDHLGISTGRSCRERMTMRLARRRSSSLRMRCRQASR